MQKDQDSEQDVIMHDQQLAAQLSMQQDPMMDQQLVAVPGDPITMLCDWGVDHRVVMKAADNILTCMYPPGGKRASQGLREEAGKLRQVLGNLWKMSSVADRYGSTITHFSQLLTNPQRPSYESFDAIFKDHAKKGYDVIHGRKVDYSNWAYKAFLLYASLHCPHVYERALQSISTINPSCAPKSDDTETSLERMGDLVECMYAVARGLDFHNIYYGVAAGTDWWKLYLDSCDVFHAMNYLQCKVHGGLLKRSMESVPRCKAFKVPVEVQNNTRWLAALAFMVVKRGAGMGRQP